MTPTEQQTAAGPHLVDELRSIVSTVDLNGTVSRTLLSRLLDYVQVLTAENEGLRRVCSACLDSENVSTKRLEQVLQNMEIPD